MAVIVTGATSFIGRAVVEELLKQGQKVYAVARLVQRACPFKGAAS